MSAQILDQSLMTSRLVTEREIKIGHHIHRELFGFQYNLDTVISTMIAGGAVLLLGWIAKRYLTRDPDDHVPSKVQLLWETIVDQVNKQVSDNLGKVHPYVAPLAISLFFFILFANWLELLPTKLNDNLHLTPAPTADTNLTYALGAFAIISVWVYGIRKNGFVGFFKHMDAGKMSDIKIVDILARSAMFLLHLIGEIVKPITLALRLFGNIFAGGIMLSLIAIIPWYYGMPVANLAWKAFDMVIGVIQAFIFALLTVLYFAMVDSHDDHTEEHSNAHDKAKKTPELAH
jgi:F-type H+-transporting ATPase subunit a